MVSKDTWQREVRLIYKEIQKASTPYDIMIDNIKLTILPNVFSPKYFTDSRWFATTLPTIVKRNRLLEIGTGTGIIALWCALNGADVTATDINPAAVKNARLNFANHGITAPVFETDIFDGLDSHEHYDCIFWNHPFNKGINPKEDMLLRAGFDYQYRSLKKYISGASHYLKPKGKLLLGTGNFADLDGIKSLAAAEGYNCTLLKKEEFLISPQSLLMNDYRIYELQPIRTKVS